MKELIFYTRQDCHLCDEALELMTGHLSGFELREVDIEGDLVLTYHYGTRIPVLKHGDDGAELGWPFDAGMLQRFLAGESQES